MQKFLKSLIDLLLYGNFWIAACALAMGLQTQYLVLDTIQWDILMGFLFLSTLFLYAVHRIVGIQKLTQYKEVERYGVIARYRHHIQLYAVIGLLGTFYCLAYLPWKVWFSLIIPGILAIGYVLPILGNENKRLRDLHFIKIFLVALVWAWMTVILPQVYYGLDFDQEIVWLFIERFFFIFAITLPFDIRDLRVDRESNVKTLPAVLGVKKSKMLGIACLAIMIMAAGINLGSGFYSTSLFMALGISAITTLPLILLTNSKSHDYLISGVIDGTMIAQFALIFLIG